MYIERATHPAYVGDADYFSECPSNQCQRQTGVNYRLSSHVGILSSDLTLRRPACLWRQQSTSSYSHVLFWVVTLFIGVTSLSVMNAFTDSLHAAIAVRPFFNGAILHRLLIFHEHFSRRFRVIHFSHNLTRHVSRITKNSSAHRPVSRCGYASLEKLGIFLSLHAFVHV